MLEGRTKQAREWREQVDTWWATRLNMPELTPRWILQQWGTEVCREGFHDDMWIASLENKLRNSTDDIVISDCRFPNEIKSIKAAGGIVIRVRRGPEPDWYNDAEEMNSVARPNHMSAKARIDKLGIHASETAWVGTRFDHVLTNDSSIDDLYAKVLSIINPEQDPPGATELLLCAGLEHN
jgi:hypothetical protein